MAGFLPVELEFTRRAAVIPRVGLGLSVDVYSPDLFELMKRLEEEDCRPGYLEIFRATGTVLQRVRTHFPTVPLAIYRFLSQPGALNYGQALAMSTLLMVVCTASLLAIESLRVGEVGEF